MTVQTHGGECPAGLCDRIIEIDTDGEVTLVKPGPVVLGSIAPDLVEAIRDQVDRADFVLIKSRPFTDTCPMAYDGQETIYTFHRASGDEVIASCTVRIDPNDPLFRAVDAAIATIPAGS